MNVFVQLSEPGMTYSQIKYEPSERIFTYTNSSTLKKDRIPITELQSFEIATDELIKKVNPSWSLALAKKKVPPLPVLTMSFGLLGSIANSMVNGINVTVLLTFSNGTKVVGVINKKNFTTIQSQIKN
ncbi:MAG: hypothetical protein P4L35_11210 [Ignavibacteriaceae bacterium]|nr:hypothetical protein [Ignavibacteriaceae bacterium]